jgi:hypothetical protein
VPTKEVGVKMEKQKGIYPAQGNPLKSAHTPRRAHDDQRQARQTWKRVRYSTLCSVAGAHGKGTDAYEQNADSIYA